MTNKLSSTLNDKEWRSTMTTIRNRSNKSELSNRMNLTINNWNKTTDLQEISERTDELKDWFNTTCNSNSNRFKYRKPKKMDTDSSQ